MIFVSICFLKYNQPPNHPRLAGIFKQISGFLPPCPAWDTAGRGDIQDAAGGPDQLRQ